MRSARGAPWLRYVVRVNVDALVELLRGRRVVVLTGAGCSTESGIPDYRGPGTARRARSPMQYREFCGSTKARQRYWARSMHGWPRVSRAEPNDAHRALADLERRGAIVGVITQNVDGLHQRAGSSRVVDLHGSLSRVRCLDCGAFAERAQLQHRLRDVNPRWQSRRRDPAGAKDAPDGDADLTANTSNFVVPTCEACSGILKPHVVFFGETVPPGVVEAAYGLLNDANALLVVGSSLVVFSGFRFVRRASQRGLPIAIVNLSDTRGHPLASVCVEAKAGPTLKALAARL